MQQPRSTAFALRKSTLLLTLLATSTQAWGQRSHENAHHAAEDAFGSSVGSESIGVYSPFSVRGFSPFAAGNIRLEGLYYDTPMGFDNRLVRGSTVRVGISAQGYPFPAPTGIGDFRLRIPGQNAVASVQGYADSFGSIGLEVDAQLPISDQLSVGGGTQLSRDKYSFDGSGVHTSAAVIARWAPTSSIEVIPFWSSFWHNDMDNPPILLTSGDALPPRIDRGVYFTQRWTAFNANDANFGSIARFRSGKNSLSAGIFRSIRSTEPVFSDLFFNIDKNGVAARHVIVGSPDQRFASVSGEVRYSRTAVEGNRLHTLHLAARGRDHRRRYGGSSLANFGSAIVGEERSIDKPEFEFGPQSSDRIRQMSGGIGYEGRWRGVGELTLGLQKTVYRKEVQAPARPLLETRASPWLYNAALAVTASDKLAFYAGMTRGLEESAAAPNFAVNRDEAPPAILTRQYDGGVRWTIGPQMRLIAGLFHVEKPYFNVDRDGVYRDLGAVRHRGAELSLVGQLSPQLSVIAGAILLDGRVLGEAVDAGIVGERPVRWAGRTLLLNIEYRPPWLKDVSFDASLNSVSRRAANASNTLFVPSLESLNLGGRYRFNLAKRPSSIRVGLNNVFDTFAWDVLGSGAFFYNNPRQLSVRLTTDI